MSMDSLDHLLREPFGDFAVQRPGGREGFLDGMGDLHGLACLQISIPFANLSNLWCSFIRHLWLDQDHGDGVVTRMGE